MLGAQHTYRNGYSQLMLFNKKREQSMRMRWNLIAKFSRNFPTGKNAIVNIKNSYPGNE